MAMLDYVLTAYRFNVFYVKKALEDIADEQMAIQPSPGMNHPAWIVGHLAMERIFLAPLLKIDHPSPAGWKELFMPLTTPTADRAKYPPKAELLAAFEESHAIVENAFLKMTDADFEAAITEPFIAKMFPKVGDFIFMMLTVHASMHVGQLSAWRRAMGYKPVLT